MEGNSYPNYVAGRMVGQGLQLAAINDLHQGNLPRALEDLAALCELEKVYANHPSLVSFMIRNALVGLSVPVCWDALQAGGWTDPQLAVLQQACRDDTILAGLPSTLEVERISHGYELNWFRTHSYGEWLARWQPIYSTFGIQVAQRKPGKSARLWEWLLGRFGVKANELHPADLAQLWRHWIFHPVWRFAWAGQEALEDLRRFQPDVEALRQASIQGSWVALNEKLTANHKAYQPPFAAWRFYLKLPLADEFGEVAAGPKARSQYPYQDFSRAWFATFQTLTLRELLITAIAIKRYQLRHGKSPESLAALVPEFLEKLTRDFMDGQPLRYRLNIDGSFTLYSVGANGRDDGGSATPEPSRSTTRDDPWSGRDWVWPRVAPTAE